MKKKSATSKTAQPIQENKAAETVTVSTMAPSDKIIPKLCTTINIALLNNKKNVIITMAYNESAENVVLIDRIAIDIDHAAALKDILTKVLKDAGHDVSNDS